MFERLTEVVKKIGCALWCHRAIYAGLAGAYGAASIGVLDKEVVNQIVTALYVLLVAQSDHRAK